MEKEICVGIDLGTTNSVVAYYDGMQVSVCVNEFGYRTMPSIVAFNNNEKLVGEAALKQWVKNPKNTIYESKRFIGKTFGECQGEAIHYPYEFLDVGDGKVNFLVKYHEEDRIFCPEEIGALILNKMAEIANTFTGCHVTRAVITVPAYFNDAQRQATRDAGRIAGLEVLRIINEPTAAAIAYGIDRKGIESIVLIFDLGGGTIDTSLLHVSADGIFEVLAIGGDTHLGGADFDQRLMTLVCDKYVQKTRSPLDLTNNVKLKSRLRQICEKAKCDLSAMHQVEIEIEDEEIIITRNEFNDVCNDLFDKCLQLLRATLADAQVTASHISEIVLVGGSTRIPKIQELLTNEFNGKPLCKSINPDEAVAYGAAIQAGILHAIDTDQPVNCDFILLDVCPLSLGVETNGGLMSTIISRNTKVPVKKSRIYSTIEDNQTDVSVSVFEGERSRCSENRLLGTFDLSGIQPSPRGTPKIRVSFELDADGIFTVTAVDESEVRLAGDQPVKPKEVALTIQNNKGRLSNEELEKIVKSAEALEAHDQLFRQCIKAKNDFESLLYNVKRTFQDHKTLHEHADKDTIQMVLDIIASEFEWLSTIDMMSITQDLINEFYRKRDWLELEVARPIVDDVNKKIVKPTD